MSASDSASTRRNSVIVLVLVVVAFAAWFGIDALRNAPTPSQPQAAAPAAAASVASMAPAPTPTQVVPATAAPTPAATPTPAAGAPTPSRPAPAPSFDIVRVDPSGSAVIAGRAAPNDKVTIRLGGQTVATATADRNGSWAVAGLQLPPGAGELTLLAEGSGEPRASAAPVVIVVPTRPAPGVPTAPGTPGATKPSPPQALALLLPPQAPPRLLQSPTPTGPGRALGLDTVDYDAQGAIRFSGTAPPGAEIRLYVDNHAVGDTRAGAAGDWSLLPAAVVAPGIHTLRLDQIGADGQAVARVELPFHREDTATVKLAAGQVVVQPGQSLWRIARNAYGQGVHYTVIYQANSAQIRDARLIYPGQLFAVPELPSAPR